jgi:hypothetical protein
MQVIRTTRPKKSAVPAETVARLGHTKLMQNLFQGPKGANGAGEGIF